jgi:amino acid transporter
LASLIQPSLLFVFGNIPFMQSGESLFRTIASIESPLWWLFYSLVIFALLSYKKRNWLENPILIYSLVLTFGYIVMSAITEVNFGTAFRHRSILVIPLIFIVLATRISLQNENLKKLDNLET